MGTDHLDLLQAHRYDHHTPLEETLRAFDDLVRQGKVHYIGVSEWSATEIAEALGIAESMGLDRIVSNQPQYSLLWRVIEPQVVPLCARRRGEPDRLLALGPGGPDRQVPARAAVPEGSRATDGRGSTFIARLLTDEVLEVVHRYCALVTEAGYTPAEAALAWVLRNENVASAIIGASRPEQVHENVRAVDITLDDQLVQAIDEVLAPIVERDPDLQRQPGPSPLDPPPGGSRRVPPEPRRW